MTAKQFDVYWVNLDPAVGSEIRKTRPAIIVSPDVMNHAVNTVVVVPITKTIIHWPFRATIKVAKQKSSAACDHIRSVSRKRLQNKIGTLSRAEQQEVLQILQTMFIS